MTGAAHNRTLAIASDTNSLVVHLVPRMKLARFAAAFALAWVTLAAHGWDDLGHMTVAAIAYEQLTPVARGRVAALLKLNPQYPDWLAAANGKDDAREAFLMAATWPDYIKHAAGYEDDGEIPLGPQAARNSGYGDRLMHKYWHYVDFPFSRDATPLAGPRAPNALTQIELFERILAPQPGSSIQADDALKSYDLVWLLHLVGDVHQPLHATSRFDREHPAGDAGGNQVRVCTATCGSLHAYWDSLLEPTGGHLDGWCKKHDMAPDGPQCASLKVAAALENARSAVGADRKFAADADVAHWIDESFAVAKVQVYATPVGTGKGPYKLDARYELAARRAAMMQASLAGVRLANLLNRAFQ